MIGIRTTHLRLPSVVLSLALGCGGARAASTTSSTPEETAAPTANAAPDAGSPTTSASGDEAARDAPAPDAPAPTDLETLIGDLDVGDVGAGAPPTFADSLDACPPDDDCASTSTAAWDGRGRRFVVLEVDASEGGAESAVLFAALPGSDAVLAHAHFDPQGVAQLRHAVRPFARLATPANLVAGSSRVEFSSSAYAPLVALAPPLDAFFLLLTTNEDVDHPEHVLSLVRRSDHSLVELGRVPGQLTPCDGDGWTCDAHPDGDDCTEAEMRAEHRLCVQPRSIHLVVRSDDGTSLLVVGTRIVAGDGGYPGHHWVVPLPP